MDEVKALYHFSLPVKLSELGRKGLLSVRAVMQEATACMGPSARFRLLTYQK